MPIPDRCGQDSIFVTRFTPREDQGVPEDGCHEPEVPRVRGRVPARRPLRLRALLRPARGRLRPLDARRRRRRRACAAGSRAGPQNIWRYADFLPLEHGQPGPSHRGTSRAGLPAGCTPLINADRLAERLGLSEVWVKNDAANPTHSFKDRVVSVADRPRPRARLRDARLRLDRQPRQRRRRPGRRARRASPTSSSRPTSRSRRSSRPASTGRTSSPSTATTTTSTASAPSSRGEREGWAFVNVNMRPYYAEGSKTLAYEIAEQLGWRDARPHRRADRLAARCSRRSPRASTSGSTLGLIDGEIPTMNGAQAAGCSPVATAFAAGHDVCRPVKPDTIAKSLAIGNPADGPYALELARATGGAHRQRHRRRDPRGHPPAGRDDRHLHRDRRRRDHRDARQARRARRHRPRRARRARHHRRGPQDARRGPRHVRRRTRSSRRYEAFEAEFALAESAALMAVTVKIPTQLRAAAGGAASAEVEGADRRRGARRALRRARRAARPHLRRRRRLRRFVNVYVDGEDIRFGEGLDTPVGRRRRGPDPAGGRRRLTLGVGPSASAGCSTSRADCRFRAWAACSRARGCERLGAGFVCELAGATPRCLGPPRARDRRRPAAR